MTSSTTEGRRNLVVGEQKEALYTAINESACSSTTAPSTHQNAELLIVAIPGGEECGPS